MILNGTFTFISLESRTANGKTYNNVNIESEDGSLMRLGVEDQCINALQKYRKYDGSFRVGAFKGEMFMRLVAVSPVPQK